MQNKPKYHKFVGKIKWASILSPITKYLSDEKEYRLNLVLDEKTEKEVIKLLRTSKAKNTIKQDGDDVVIKFSRKHTQKKKDGTTFTLTPPVVTDSNGNPWNKDVLIGNGSLAAVTIQETSFKSQHGDVTRLALFSVQVLELVEYKKEGLTNEAKKPIIEDDDLNF